MKKGTFLLYLGIFLAIACPLYEVLDSKINNIEGDGMTVYGDNPIFRNILGVYTRYSYLDPGKGWSGAGLWHINTPPWMQILGMPKLVTQDSLRQDGEMVILFRCLIKLIPFFIILLGLFYRNKTFLIEPPEA